MKIAYFLLPYNPQFDIAKQASHQHVRTRLLERFGGFTASLVEGAWKDEAGKVHYDTSVKYEVAADWASATELTSYGEFKQIAREGGALQPQWQRDGKAGPPQECVLVCDPAGTVTLPDCLVTVPKGYCHQRI